MKINVKGYGNFRIVNKNNNNMKMHIQSKVTYEVVFPVFFSLFSSSRLAV
jgi:hypothetical protein